MKKQPDETTLTLWMDGELEGDERLQVEAWASEHPEVLAERDAVQALRAGIKSSIPASVEPPYADFFNQRILRQIQEEAEPVSTRQPVSWGRLGRWLALPVTAAAMAVCFYLGTQVGDGPQVSPPAYTVASVPTVYTPDGEVHADMFKSEDAGVTVIVLQGLEDIPDDIEIVGEPAASRPGRTGEVMVRSEPVF